VIINFDTDDSDLPSEEFIKSRHDAWVLEAKAEKNLNHVCRYCGVETATTEGYSCQSCRNTKSKNKFNTMEMFSSIILL